MKINKVIFDQSTFGTTGKSLKMLRNALVNNLHDEILVIEIPTNDILCGFLVVNKNEKTATWSGDGFRTDKGGEGGRGYKAAEKMLEVFGIRYLNAFTEEAIQQFKDATAIYSSETELSAALLKACNKVMEEFEEEEFKCVYDTPPMY